MLDLPALPLLAALPDLPSIGQIAGGVVAPGATIGMKSVSDGLHGFSITDIVTIVVGLLFILGAFLTFDSTRGIITTAAKSAAAVAA